MTKTLTLLSKVTKTILKHIFDRTLVRFLLPAYSAAPVSIPSLYNTRLLDRVPPHTIHLNHSYHVVTLLFGAMCPEGYTVLVVLTSCHPPLKLCNGSALAGVWLAGRPLLLAFKQETNYCRILFSI